MWDCLLFLFLSTRKQQSGKRTVWATALAYSQSALHLSHHHGGSTDSWYVGNRSSRLLPLVLAILYEDRFAFTDIFEASTGGGARGSSVPVSMLALQLSCWRTAAEWTIRSSLSRCVVRTLDPPAFYHG